MAESMNPSGVRLDAPTNSSLRETLPVTDPLTTLPSWHFMQGHSQFIGKHGVCNMPSIPMRTEPSDAAEMDGQLLFGDVFTVIDAEKGCLKILREFARHGTADEYSLSGWIDAHLVPAMIIETDEFNLLRTENHYGYVASSGALVQDLQTGEPMRLPWGSVLPFYASSNPTSQVKIQGFNVAGRPFTVTDDQAQIFQGHASRSIGNFRRIVSEVLGTQYLWGGQSSNGIDCSGFTQALARMFGTVLPRNSGAQAKTGEQIDLSQATIGSMPAFGPKGADRVTHIGFFDVTCEGEPGLVHAKQKVKFQRLERTTDGSLMYPESIEGAELKGITDPLNLREEYF